ncbi:MAG: hypothetical protein QOH59_51, partial [Gemmatimonadales bacterium]|nr:hypothetical protein [Gemmatimonadales bacterium]
MRDRTPWLIAGAALAAALALILDIVARDSKGGAPQPDVVAVEQPEPGETPTDISY